MCRSFQGHFFFSTGYDSEEPGLKKKKKKKITKADAAMKLVSSLLVCIFFIAGGARCQELNFFQISDLHLDSLYSTDGTIDERCHKPDYVTEGDGLGPAGDYRCDPPYVLVESAIRHMKRVNPDPDFILWTGDSSPHWKDGPDFEYIFKNLKNITKLFRNYFKDAFIVPVLGNHDTNPPDYYLDSKINATRARAFYSRYIEQGAWGDMIRRESWDTFKQCGFYSTNKTVANNKTIKFILLNTNLYYYNLKVKLDPVDPCGQLEWLSKELEATPDGVQVFISAHVPPGYFERDLHLNQSTFTIPNGDKITERYVQIMTDRSNAKKIAAHFYGHTHTDTFRLFMENNKAVAMGLGFICPSVTPSLYLGAHKPYGTNPSFREYQYDASKATVTDYVQHMLDLESVNRNLTAAAEAAAAEGDTAADDRRQRNAKLTKGFSRNKREDIEAQQQNDGATADTTQEPDPTSAEDEQETTVVTTTLIDRMDTETTTPTSSVPPDLLPEPISGQSAVLEQFWKVGYRARSAFNTTDLSLKQMQLTYVNMMHDKSGPIFLQFFKHNTMFHVLRENTTCLGKCHDDIMCTIAHITHEQMATCIGEEEAETTAAIEKASSATFPPLDTTSAHMTPPTVVATTPSSAILNTTPPMKDPSKEKKEGGSSSVNGVAIGFAIVMVMAVAVGGLFLYKRVQRNRYRSQEFLLSDNLFRYDGYAQVNE